MNRIYLITMLFCLLAIGAQAQTPPPTNTNGPVWRVTYFKVKPGKGPEYVKFLRENAAVILAEQKKQGLILDFKYLSQPTSDGPNDWDIAQVVVYKNYADALDFNAERITKINAISLKHYGTTEARTKANDSLNDPRTVLSSQLGREEY